MSNYEHYSTASEMKLFRKTAEDFEENNAIRLEENKAALVKLLKEVSLAHKK